MKNQETLSEDLAKLQSIWYEEIHTHEGHTALEKYTSEANYSEVEQQLLALKFMLDTFCEERMPSATLALFIIRLLDNSDNAKILYSEPPYRHKIAAALILCGDGLMPFDDAELVFTKRVVEKITGCEINILEETAPQIADIFYGKMWTDLIQSEWRFSTPGTKKVADIMLATLLPARNPDMILHNNEIPTGISF